MNKNDELKCLVCDEPLDEVHEEIGTHPSCDPEGPVGEPLDRRALERYLAKDEGAWGWTIVGEEGR